MVPRTDLIADLGSQIEDGNYFTIYAPRQVGKTTLLRQIVSILEPKPDLLPVAFSMEGVEGASVPSFLNVFWSEFGDKLAISLRKTGQPVEHLMAVLADNKPTDFAELLLAWRRVHESLMQYRLVLIIDEFDGIPQEAISPMLQIWRNIYLNDVDSRSLHSVVLVGLQNIATLNLGRSSPFNIAREVSLPNFSVEQVQDLYEQFQLDSGQPILDTVVREIYQLTGGQPFLVNRIGAILAELMDTDSVHPLSLEDLQQARQILVKERNWNFETICRRAEAHREEVLEILFGKSYRFSLHSPLIHYLHMHGIVTENPIGDCQVANPIYAQVLTEYLGPPNRSHQGDILINGKDARVYIQGEHLDMPAILADFRIFVERRGKQAFEIGPTPQEATGQYLLMAYLESITRQLGGSVLAETPSGDGILDLIVVYNRSRYIVETKIWRGAKKFDDGRDQLLRYLEKEGQTTGYYVVFHTRPTVYGKLNRDDLEFMLDINGKEIYVYLVRLGEIL